ncbi:hypothetical protein [Butyricicoccus porcorum]|uniref:Uncharacterized protein n=1 Tax=Butyricicoccus porcorum TaxID=1945634 RepID=A0A252F630_9FIRM|nr:hypothetical protein [Butyricicoccus porcorum]OUM21223.1 hypothetical protein CBW42_04115 [Butyricicoccus porcorum]
MLEWVIEINPDFMNDEDETEIDMQLAEYTHDIADHILEELDQPEPDIEQIRKYNDTLKKILEEELNNQEYANILGRWSIMVS